MFDVALQIKYASYLLNGPEYTPSRVFVTHAHETKSHGPEQWLDDDIAQMPERGHSIVESFADDGLGCHQASFMKQRRRIKLVDRSLDRTGRVDDPYADILEPMQRIDAINDLLERSIGNYSGEDDVAGVQRRVGATGAQSADDAFVRNDARNHIPRTQRAAELVGMPTLPRGQYRDGGTYGVSMPVSAVNPPLANSGMSSATALKPGVDVPFFSASIEANVSSALR